jgi:23S rRNA pseudouridine2605 synthase
MRLNRFLARSGVASRRGADEIVEAGRVKINGITVTSHGVTVDTDSDRVEVA